MNQLITNGCIVEIVYRGVFAQDAACVEIGGGGLSASTRRRNWINGAREVVRASGGKVMITSGAKVAGEMRGTEDLINLWVCSSIRADFFVESDSNGTIVCWGTAAY